ncbi:hypothetical protein QYF36_026018 [Acer negundo]|nr:hypothetical protein QYF36_026018 [Acer negundo]
MEAKKIRDGQHEWESINFVWLLRKLDFEGPDNVEPDSDRRQLLQGFSTLLASLDKSPVSASTDQVINYQEQCGDYFYPD